MRREKSSSSASASKKGLLGLTCHDGIHPPLNATALPLRGCAAVRAQSRPPASVLVDPAATRS